MDPHFLLQNSLTGFIFITFAGLGLWTTNESIAYTAGNILSNQWQIVAAVISTPIIGVLVQGLWMAFSYMVGHPYQSRAREIVANPIKNAVQSLVCLSVEVTALLTDDIPNDSKFVWLLYSEAPSHMIEWYRRRLTFRHLGENWATAIVSGSLFGMIIGQAMNSSFSQSKTVLIILLIGGSLTLTVGLFFLSRKMNNDAKGFEATWLYSIIYPEFKKYLKTQKEIEIPIDDGSTTKVLISGEYNAELSGLELEKNIKCIVSRIIHKYPKTEKVVIAFPNETNVDVILYDNHTKRICEETNLPIDIFRNSTVTTDPNKNENLEKHCGRAFIADE